MTNAVFIESDKSGPNELGRLDNEEHVYERVNIFKNIKETEYKIAAAEKTIALFESFVKGEAYFKDNGVIIRSSKIKHFFLCKSLRYTLWFQPQNSMNHISKVYDLQIIKYESGF